MTGLFLARVAGEEQPCLNMKLFKPSYLKKLWIVIILIAGLSFIVGQFALYLFYANL